MRRPSRDACRGRLGSSAARPSRRTAGACSGTTAATDPTIAMPDATPATPGQRRTAWLLAPGARYHLMASALFVVVFAIIPFSIYAHSGEDWNFRFHRLLWLPALGAALCASAWLLIRLSAALSRKLAVALACLLFCLGLFALLAQVYTPIQVGPLDGAALESDEPLLHTALEAGF